jgi:hypothetical protein
MPKFVTIGYGDRAGYDATPLDVRTAAHAHDERLRKDGAVMGIAGAPVQVRNQDAKDLQVTNGPFMASALPIAGFAIIDAASLEAAIRLVAQVPCAVARGVVEIWPLDKA